MNQEVFISGIGRCGYDDPDSSRLSLNELIFRATRRALDDAGLTLADIDSVVLAAHDVNDGRGITSMTTAGAAGALLKDEVRVAEDGLWGVSLAAARLEGGHYGASLVVAWGKPSETDPDIVSRLSWEPFFDRPIAQNEKIALALQSAAYRAAADSPHLQDTGRRFADRQRHGAGKGDPQATGAVAVADPLTSSDIVDDHDGACAIVLTNADRTSSDRRSVRLLGSGWCSESYYLGSREGMIGGSLALATQSALAASGVDRIDDVDVIELDVPTADHYMMGLEAIGLCEPGRGADFLRDHLDGRPGPELGVKGGAFRWQPQAASGLARLIDVVENMRSNDARLGMAHGYGGNAWQSHNVCMVGRSASA